MVKQQDDFVLTISDNEEDVGLSEEEVEHTPAAAQANKKRKRDDPPTKKSKKEQHKSKKVKAVAPVDSPQEDDASAGEEDWAARGEDDGALDSDFEFQAEEGYGNVGEFDSWNAGVVKKESQNAAALNLSVDVDDIIERRRQAKEVKADKLVKKAQRRAEYNATHGIVDEDGDEDDEVETSFADLEGVIDLDGEAASDDDEVDVDKDEGDDEDADSIDETDIKTEDEDGDAESEDEAAPVAHPDDLAADSEAESDAEPEDAAEVERRAAFFAPESNLDGSKPPSSKTGGSFQAMQLSRPILKGLAAVGFSEPTPIQAQSIPVALLGKDVVGGAVTGSGKTGAFIIPILERLLYRPKKVPTTRVAILMPTRELAVQCFNVAKKLAGFTDITFALIVGGFSLREQEQVLKSRPDVVIATPGRFIDHMRNSPSFTVDTLEILVLDEADRMLEDGFADELNEILTTIPKSRQTMLFSATMTDSVDKLIRVGLNRPVRLMINAKKQTVSGLVQEFVRLRPGREDKRLACLLHLCDKVYTDKTIVFFRQKKEAHRVRIVFGLCGMKAAELHGSMSQEQRIASVESFRNGSASFLLATDLASRGLDIKGVSTVINYEAPQTHEIYLHRVGRTARAGRTGRACTLASEPDRKIVKAAVKAARSQGAKVASRIVPVDIVDAWDERIEGLHEDIDSVLEEEKEEKAMTLTEREVKRVANIIEHKDEIMARPKRTWFESQTAKEEAQAAGRRELNPDTNKPAAEKKKGTQGKLSNKDKKKMLNRDERTESRSWKKGSDVRGKSIAPAARDKKAEKAKKVKAIEKKAKKGKGKR